MPASPSDIELLALRVGRARKGDRAALRELYESHAAAVHGYCSAFARGDAVLAEDLCQESFVTAFGALEQLSDPQRFSGWLRTITRRTCLGWAERSRSTRKAMTRLAAEPVHRPGSPETVSRVVTEVIDACPDDGLRMVARLFYTHPPSTTAEIAVRLGLSQTAVTSRLHRFRAWARAQMLEQLSAALEAS